MLKYFAIYLEIDKIKRYIMAKIIVIGCPGSGKSTMTFRLKEILNCPVLHLDKIYHIDNHTRISREELVRKVDTFAKNNDHWIIDGNYISTIEQRVKLADTVILLNLDMEICLQNAIARSKKDRTADMADGFDNSKIEDEFIESIIKFKADTLPRIFEILEQYKNEKKIIILKDYEEVNNFLHNLTNL